MAFESTQYSGTRVRCQRMADAKIFNGWVRELTEGSIDVTFDPVPTVQPAERFAFEVYGFTQNVIVLGEVSGEKEDGVLFRLVSHMRLTSPVEGVRMKTDAISVFCTCVFNGDEYELEVTDVSSGGVGLISYTELPRGEVLDFRFETQYGVAEGKGEIRYCKRSPLDGSYRVGVKLQFESRVSRGRWAQLFPQAA